MSKLWQAIRLNSALKGIKRLWNRIPDGLIAGTSPPLCTGGIVGTLVAEWF